MNISLRAANNNKKDKLKKEQTSMNEHIGRQTIRFGRPPVIAASAAIAGEKEGEGPLRDSFDCILSDDSCGAKTWEQSEAAILSTAASYTLKKAKLSPNDVDYILGGDLLNQCVSAHYGLRDLNIPFFGLYGACSTMVEGLSLASVLVAGDFAKRAMCVTSSHFCSSEKQFRYPLEYGGQRAPSAQWTVTGSGCALVSRDGAGPKITHITTGRIIDKGITDIANMGAAMAPAAIDTLTAHFKDTGRRPEDYDLILTGDLGTIGSDILKELMLEEGYDIGELHNDCGKMIFDIENQDVHAGGSGCGCCGSVLCGHILRELNKGVYDRILVMATGALMNPMTVQQGESIPAIAHAAVIERRK